MRILVTGGTGYIGSHTCVELINAGYDVVIADNLVNSKLGVIDGISKITGKTPKFYKVDVCSAAELHRVFEENTIDAVIHFAAFKAVGESVKKPIAYYKNNIGGILQLVECMSEFGVKKIIFSSSATVYSDKNKMPLTENSILGCSNPYGWTKLVSEQILRDKAASDSEWSVMLLRYFNPIGAHESGIIGEETGGIPNNLMPYIMRVAAGKFPELHVFGNDYNTPDGTGVRDYVHVCDVACGHVAALEYAKNISGVETVNLGTGIGHSVLEIIAASERACGKKIPYVIDLRRPGDVAECYADTNKAKKLLNWEAKRSLDEMCRDSWRYILNSL